MKLARSRPWRNRSASHSASVPSVRDLRLAARDRLGVVGSDDQDVPVLFEHVEHWPPLGPRRLHDHWPTVLCPHPVGQRH
jgi:hypothetical protein